MEEAGRLVRYDCFATFAEKWNCNKIAVAHHKNDLAETVLFRMARGTGIRGLSGIRPVNGALIRPLLCLEKEEIVRMLQALGQSYEEDSSNRDDSYSRNYIRLRLLPDLQAVNARAVEHLGQLSGQAAELMDYLEPVFEKNIRTDGGLPGGRPCCCQKRLRRGCTRLRGRKRPAGCSRRWRAVREISRRCTWSSC